MARLAVVAVLVHAVIAIAHGMAHRHLDVTLSAFQSAYVVVVIGFLPILAVILMWWTSLARLGLALLTISMTGALGFGMYWHYLAVSPDNVFSLPNGSHATLFQSTALLLAVSETCGLVIGLWGMNKAQRGAGKP